MVVTDAELVARANGAAVGEHDLQQFFALYVLSGFVFKRGNNTLGAGVDDVAGGGISAAAVDAEGDPAGLVAQFDALRLLRRHHGGSGDMNAAVGAVGKPQLFFVGRERNAVAGAAMPLGRPFLIASNLDAMQHFPGFAISYFKAEQLVDVDEAKGLAAIDCEWANGIAEGADLVHNRVGFRVRNRKNGRPQAGKIDTGAIRSVDRVMRAGIELDLRDYVSGCSVDDVPVRTFEGRHVEYFSVR